MNLRMFHWRRPALWLCLPVVIILAAGIWFASREFMASRRYEATIQMLRDNSRPVSNADLKAAYEAGTHREGIELWDKSLFLLDSLNRFRSSQQLDTWEPEIIPGETWQHEEVVKQLLAKARPALDMLHEATLSPKPVWQPIEFDGLDTQLGHLQRATRSSGLLNLEIEDALRSGDGDRAMRGIVDMFATAEAFDVPLFMISQHSNIYMQLTGYSYLRRGLSVNAWTQEQLTELAQLANQPFDIDDSWTQIVESTAAALIVTLGENSPESQPVDQGFLYWLAKLPSSKEACVNQLLAYRDCPTDNVSGFRKQLDALSSSKMTLLQAALQNQLSLTWTGYIGVGLTRAEDERRIAATSLAIKKFQLANGHWPEELSELLTEGLPRECLLTVDNRSFGYEVKDGVAYTWKYRFPIGNDYWEHDLVIPEKRPTDFNKTESSSISAMPVTTIR